ncbi:MAG: tyrosine-type recombinase/integrase, partial [Alphaproteobacteria bacterium]|nr:tyrosine-type recombinase/integrase [Alphaproteobacteria bacterium]
MLTRKNRNPVSTDLQVAGLARARATYLVRIRNTPGLYVRVTPKGFKSFVAVARDRHGKQVWHTVGGMELYIAIAIEQGREVIRRIKAGLAPVELPGDRPQTVAEVAAEYFSGHVLNKRRVLRTAPELKRLLDRFILPRWGKRPFSDLGRGDVARALDTIERDNGAHQADQVLRLIRGLMIWYAGRNDKYLIPLIPRMNRVKEKKDRERDRVLDHDEIRAVWTAAEDAGPFGGFIQLLLLTGQRRAKVAAMRWSDIEDGTWNIATEDREKGNAETLVLPPLALAIIDRQHRIVGNEYVFAGRGAGHFKGYSTRKRDLDVKVGDIPAWRFHDLRRTCRSLLAETGVDRHVAERVLGHVLAGVEGVYDRHDYKEEKAAAL